MSANPMVRPSAGPPDQERFREQMAAVTRYKNAEQRLEGTQTRRCRRPQKLRRKKIMEEAKRTSAVVEHISQCSRNLHPKIICRESLFHLRQIKEALLIRYNATINRDKGRKVNEALQERVQAVNTSNKPGPVTGQSIFKSPAMKRNANAHSLQLRKLNGKKWKITSKVLLENSTK